LPLPIAASMHLLRMPASMSFGVIQRRAREKEPRWWRPKSLASGRHCLDSRWSRLSSEVRYYRNEEQLLERAESDRTDDSTFLSRGRHTGLGSLCSYWSFRLGHSGLRRRKQQQRLWHAAPRRLAVTQVGKYALMVKAASGNMTATQRLLSPCSRRAEGGHSLDRTRRQPGERSAYRETPEGTLPRP